MKTNLLLHSPCSINLSTNNYIKTIKDKILEELIYLKKSYLPDISEELFYKNFIFHESVVMKCLAYRLANENLLKSLCCTVLDQLKDSKYLRDYTNENFLIHPLFYIRVSDPRYFNVSEEKSLLESQPHYDRSFNLSALSIWVAVSDVNLESGGLCFFNNSPIIKELFETKWGEKNKLNTDLYLKNNDYFDSLVSDDLRPPNLTKGSAYVFDSDTLHGAIRSKTQRRISFDFRIFPESHLSNIDSMSKNLIAEFNNDINAANKKNLLVLGDHIGAKSKYPDIMTNSIKSKYKITEEKKKLFWRDEYCWSREA